MSDSVSVRRLIYLVAGPPGAGKTTALRTLGYRHRCLARFGVRDYGLRLAEAGDPLGLAVRRPLLRNELLPDDLVLAEFTHFMHHLSREISSVTVEGYPRSLHQCIDLVGAVAARRDYLAGLVALQVPVEIACNRVTDRRICKQCGLPTSAGIPACSSCGGGVVRRLDDNPTRFRRRLEEYRKFGEEVWPYFAERDLLHVIDGQPCPVKVCRELEMLMFGDKPICEGSLHRTAQTDP